jgi:hypothetical protein
VEITVQNDSVWWCWSMHYIYLVVHIVACMVVMVPQLRMLHRLPLDGDYPPIQIVMGGSLQ